MAQVGNGQDEETTYSASKLKATCVFLAPTTYSLEDEPHKSSVPCRLFIKSGWKQEKLHSDRSSFVRCLSSKFRSEGAYLPRDARTWHHTGCHPVFRTNLRRVTWLILWWSIAVIPWYKPWLLTSIDHPPPPSLWGETKETWTIVLSSAMRWCWSVLASASCCTRRAQSAVGIVWRVLFHCQIWIPKFLVEICFRKGPFLCVVVEWGVSGYTVSLWLKPASCIVPFISWYSHGTTRCPIPRWLGSGFLKLCRWVGWQPWSCVFESCIIGLLRARIREEWFVDEGSGNGWRLPYVISLRTKVDNGACHLWRTETEQLMLLVCCWYWNLNVVYGCNVLIVTRCVISRLSVVAGMTRSRGTCSGPRVILVRGLQLNECDVKSG